MAVYVHLRRWPFNCHAQAWGLASDGWWGLITWEQPVRIHGEAGTLRYAAWVPADHLSKPDWASGGPLRRVRLPEDQARWPAPAGWDGHYLGAWPAGEMSAPDGVEVVTEWRS